MMIEFRALGPLVVLDDGSQVPLGGARQRRLLAMLLIHRNSVVSVDRLADAVFAGQPTDAARTTIRSYVARMRRVLGDGTTEAALLTEPPGYSLRAVADVVDVGRFETLSAEGNRLLADGDASQAAHTFQAALGLWRGRAYEEFDDEEWAQPEAQRLEELRLVTEERLIEAELACGKAADVIARLETLIVHHPLRETFRAQLMLALYRSGRQVDALRSYSEYRTTLAEEIGIDPSRNLADLEQSILSQDPTLDLAEAAGRALRGYRLGVRIGVGPNGAIHRARVPGVDADAALSILHDPRVDEIEFVRAFDSNANRLASLRHPSVVPVQDYWREPGAAYVVTRLPTGIPLRDRLQRGPIALREIVALVRQVGGALSEAAALGTRHGGISLDNIWIDERAIASIAHFSICPSGADTDVHDFGSVIRACLDRCDQELDPVWRDAIETEIEEARHGSMLQFVERVGAALRDQVSDRPVERPNPFKGLQSFDESDAGDFFGRDEWVEQLVARVCAERLTLVVGGSGSGKSSVVRAGLLPRVRSGGACGPMWFVTTMMPGSAPFKELGEALRRVAVDEARLATVANLLRGGSLGLDEAVHTVLPDDARLLLVIDQFEELFTLTAEAEHRAFLDMLADSIESSCGRVHVVATLRADFYDRPLAYQRFGALAAAATVPLPAMAPADLEAAIVGPLTRIGASAEPALVAELVSAVVDQPSALPSLQFTLYELAGRRADRCLTLADYAQLGGVEQAIAGRAEYLYRSLDRGGQDVVRRVFEQLVAIGVDAEPTGRRRERADLATGPTAPDVQEMIDQWMAARLLTGDHDPRSRVPTVQLAHEAILTSWPRLRQWIDDDRQAIIGFDHLHSAAAEWSEGDWDAAMLYRGARLQAALDLVDSHPQFVPTAEREFLAASVDLRDREDREAAERLEQQARANRRLRIQLGAIAVALVVALGVGFVAVEQRGNAQRQRDTAEAARLEAQAERDAADVARRETQIERDAADSARRDATARELAAAAESNVEIDPERAIHLALLAIDETRSVDGTVIPQAVDALHHAVSSTRILLDVPDVGGRLDWSPTDDIFVTEGPEESGMIDVRSATTGKSLLSFRGDAVDVNEVVFSADGTMLAVVGDDGTAKVFDPYTGELLHTVEGSGPTWAPSFNHDGTMLLTSWPGVAAESGVVRMTDLATGVVSAAPANLADIHLSPDATRVAVSGGPKPSVLSLPKLETVAELQATGPVGALRWSPDGSKIATAGGEGAVEVFNAQSGERLGVGTHDAHVLALAWSRDGTRLASGSYDGTARVWTVDDSSLTEEFRFQVQDFANGVAGVAFSPDGDRLAVSDFDITSTKIFDLRAIAAGELATLPVDPRVGVAFTPDTGEVIVATPDGAITVADPETGETVRTIEVDVSEPGFQLSPDADRIAVGSGDLGEFHLYDATTAAPLWMIDLGPNSSVDALAWSPDGEYVALSSSHNRYRDTVLRVLDRAGNTLSSWTMPNTWVGSLDFSADGQRLAIARTFRDRANDEAETVQLWDWRRGEVVGELRTKAIDVRFDRSGRYIATTRFNQGEGDVWDATTLERVSTLFGSETYLSALAFSPDGSRLATGSRDGMIRIWDPATGRQQQRLDAGRDVVSVAFAPDGQRLLSTDVSGVARVWELDLDRLIAIAEGRLTRELTDGECLQYLGTTSCPTS